MSELFATRIYIIKYEYHLVTRCFCFLYFSRAVTLERPFHSLPHSSAEAFSDLQCLPNDAYLKQLRDEGYDVNSARMALKILDNDLEKTRLILSHFTLKL